MASAFAKCKNVSLLAGISFCMLVPDVVVDGSLLALQLTMMHTFRVFHKDWLMGGF